MAAELLGLSPLSEQIRLTAFNFRSRPISPISLSAPFLAKYTHTYTQEKKGLEALIAIVCVHPAAAFRRRCPK